MTLADTYHGYEREPDRRPLKCWLVLDLGTMEDALLIVERSRSKAIQRWADEHSMMFHECIERGSEVRAWRRPQFDTYLDRPGEIFASGPYLHAGCWVECVRCDRMIDRQHYDDETFGLVLDGWGYCVDCAARLYGIESEDDDAGAI